jgi:hypothetical protein
MPAMICRHRSDWLLKGNARRALSGLAQINATRDIRVLERLSFETQRVPEQTAFCDLSGETSQSVGITVPFRRDGTTMKGRLVVITGAGRATAHCFACAGADLALIARDGDALEETRSELARFGGRVYPFALDVADAAAVFDAVQRIEHLLGPIDVWFNNTMLTAFSPVSAITPEEFRRITEVTYLGFVHGTMAALQHMRARSGHHRAGRILARLSRHPAAGRLLRGQARDPRIHRLAAHRAHP